MRILITGGIGFIGTNASIFFGKNKANKLVLVDNFSRPGVEKNASFLKKNFSNIKIVQSNILETNKYLSDLKKADLIIHLAGQTAVTSSIKNPNLDFNSNLIGGFKLLEAVRKHHPKSTLIFASTNKVYGNLEHHQFKKDIKNKRYNHLCHPKGIDEKENLEFISPYGCSKGALDQYFIDYGRIYGLKTIVFRQSCIYGPFQIGVEDQGWVSHFAKQLILKKPITIFGNGYQIRDLLNVKDLIQAYQLAIDNIEKINHLLGWQVKTDFKTGLKNMINWQKEFFKK